MIFFPIKICLRTDVETLNGINELLDKYSDKYLNMSHVIRCAIISLVNEERLQEENENRKIRKIRER